MTEQSVAPARRTGLIVAVVVLAVVAIAVVAGFVIPAFAGTGNLLDFFNAIRAGR